MSNPTPSFRPWLVYINKVLAKRKEFRDSKRDERGESIFSPTGGFRMVGR
jgi:hypothetical protein